MKKIFSLILALAACSSVSFAQSAGDEIESYTRFTASFVTAKAHAANITSDADNGVSVGLLKGIPLSQKLPVFFEIGVNATWLTQSVDDGRETIITASVPLNLSYKISLPALNNVSIQPFAGINGKVHCLGQYKEDGYKFNYFSEDDMGDLKFNRCQLGFQAGVGVNISSFYIGYQFSGDCTYLQGDAEEKLRAHFATIGMNF